MKHQPIQKLFACLSGRQAFIITIMMFSVLPEIANAQIVKAKKRPPVYCNCNVRPIPFKCGQICGFLADTPPSNDVLSISGIYSTAISFELTESKNVSLKIYDLTGRLVKTLANSRMPQGEYQIAWNRKDEAGNPVKAGLYTLQFDAGTYSGTKKLSVVK